MFASINSLSLIPQMLCKRIKTTFLIYIHGVGYLNTRQSDDLGLRKVTIEKSDRD